MYSTSKMIYFYMYCQSLTSSISIAEIREPPHISQANTVANTGEQKLIFAAPLLSGGLSGRSWGRRRRLMFSCWLGHGPVLMMSFKAYNNHILGLYNGSNTFLSTHITSIIWRKMHLSSIWYLIDSTSLNCILDKPVVGNGELVVSWFV